MRVPESLSQPAAYFVSTIKGKESTMHIREVSHQTVTTTAATWTRYRERVLEGKKSRPIAKWNVNKMCSQCNSHESSLTLNGTAHTYTCNNIICSVYRVLTDWLTGYSNPPPTTWGLGDRQIPASISTGKWMKIGNTSTYKSVQLNIELPRSIFTSCPTSSGCDHLFSTESRSSKKQNANP